jgi:hypothetical protein
MELEELAEPEWMSAGRVSADWVSADQMSGTYPEPPAFDDRDTFWVDAYEL